MLLSLARCTVTADAADVPADEHLRTLRTRADSDLERRFLDLLARQHRRLPSDSQLLIESAGCRPDFHYRHERVAVFVDGPHHDLADQRRDDDDATARLEDAGYEVIRFHHAADWAAVLDAHPDVFGANGASA